MIIDQVFKCEDYILFTDSWHPTINPSSRMPIHHLRYNSLFDKRTGILTEVPRRNGGSTLREMIFFGHKLKVKELNTPIEWFPWWKACDEPIVLNQIRDIILAGDLSNDNFAKLAYQDFYRRYSEIITIDSSLTVGEAVNRVNNSICQEMTGIVAPELISYTKHSNYGYLKSSYEQISYEIYDILDRLLDRLGKNLFGMLAIVTNYENKSWRIRYSQNRDYFTAINTQDENDKIRLPSDMLLYLLKKKKLLPGSVFSCLLESVVACQGKKVFHYGNTYGYFELIAEVLGISQVEKDRIGFFRDNEDSWNYADLIMPDGMGYPIHLLDTWKRDSMHSKLTDFIRESFNSRKTLFIPLGEEDSLESAIFNRRS